MQLERLTLLPSPSFPPPSTALLVNTIVDFLLHWYVSLFLSYCAVHHKWFGWHQLDTDFGLPVSDLLVNYNSSAEYFVFLSANEAPSEAAAPIPPKSTLFRSIHFNPPPHTWRKQIVCVCCWTKTVISDSLVSNLFSKIGIFRNFFHLCSNLFSYYYDHFLLLDIIICCIFDVLARWKKQQDIRTLKFWRQQQSWEEIHFTDGIINTILVVSLVVPTTRCDPFQCWWS